LEHPPRLFWWVFIWKVREGRIFSYEQFHDPAIAQAFR
jgi:ketosteroid isomerase-like protein